MRALGEQRLEGIEKFLLGSFFAGKKLDVVDQQQIERVVFGLQLIECLALIVLDDVGDELFGVQIKHPRLGPIGQQCIADGVNQVRLSQPDAPVNEQGVVHDTWGPRDMQCRGACHLVGAAGDQVLKGEVRIQA